jgi:hypothetical protein
MRRVGAGEKYQPPDSITIRSGDVHRGHLAEAAFSGGITQG